MPYEQPPKKPQEPGRTSPKQPGREGGGEKEGERKHEYDQPGKKQGEF